MVRGVGVRDRERAGEEGEGVWLYCVRARRRCEGWMARDGDSVIGDGVESETHAG